ncbi:MAG: M14 family zinc carboxypeptidase [Sedimentibacter sp.]
MDKFIVDTSDTYFLDDIYKDIDTLCEKYSSVLSKLVIGKSVEGRDIVALKVSGKKDDIFRGIQNSKVKPSVLFVGGIHAREDFSVMLCMKMIDYYCCCCYNEEKSFDDFNVMKIIDNVDMYFVPVVNPDGLNIVHNGLESSSSYEQLKTMYIWGEDHSYWKANANGVDLNKNFDDGNWEVRTCVPGTEVPCSDRFKGYAPNSEPETQALVNFCNENNFSLMVTYHCSGNCTFWADSGTHGMFNGLDEKIMDELNKNYIYRKTKVSMDPKIYGCGFENWFRVKMKRPAFCIELSPFVEGGKQHPDSMFDELVWKHAKTTGLFFAEKAIEVCDEIYGDVEKYAALTE